MIGHLEAARGAGNNYAATDVHCACLEAARGAGNTGGDLDETPSVLEAARGAGNGWFACFAFQPIFRSRPWGG